MSFTEGFIVATLIWINAYGIFSFFRDTYGEKQKRIVVLTNDSEKEGSD